MRRIVDFVSGFATNVTLEAVKVVTEAIRDRLPSALATDRLKVDGSGVTQPVSVASVPLAPDAATATNQATEIAGLTSIDIGIAAILAKLIAAPATETKQDAGNASLVSILAKIIAAPATEAKQDTGNASLATLAGIVSAGKALVTETSAAAILAKLSSDPSTATLQTTINTNITNLRAQITATLGQAARASSLGVTLSTEDAAKVPSLGQALAASSVPVVLTAIQIAQLAQTGQLPATLGTLASSGSLSVVRSVASIDKQTTLATAGKVIKASAGICYGLTSYFNNTGGAIFFQVFNTTATPTAGDRPDYFSASIASGTKSSLGFGITALGIGCPTGITFAVSSTQDTFTAIASTAVIYALQYD